MKEYYSKVSKTIGERNMYEPDEECREMIAKISRLCKQRHITPHALAKQAGLSTSTISYLLSEKTKPQVYTILQICRVLDISICDLFMQDIQTLEKSFSAEEKKFIAGFRELSEKKKLFLKACMNLLLEAEDTIF